MPHGTGMVGQTISHYKVTAELGRGGMGIVYKAEDTKLDRTVALKFLAPHLLEDEEARKRFHREAKAAAGLSHPNICTVYEIGEEDGQTFLVMEFIEGEGLDNKIERGPMPLKEALAFARQVADGLAAAHANGVVHRDIKPGNLIVTPEGRVKILDFGLALLTEDSKLTQLDGTVGTVAYMSPEQAQGIEVDYRTDIWALGCVTYEMVRGQRPFQGVYDQALVYEIVNQEVEPLTAVRAGVPMELEWMVGKCLAKDREDRYGRAEDMMLDLRTLAEKLKSGKSTVLRTAAGPGGTVATGNLAGPSPRSGDEQTHSVSRPRDSRAEPAPTAAPAWKTSLPWALLAATAVVAIVLAFVLFRQAPPEAPEAPLRRFAFTPESLYETTGWRAAISPNGRHIVYVAGGEERKLWVRDLDREEPREVDGTEGAVRPFWSPDSQFIGFVANQELKKISLQGGPAITLCPLLSPFFSGGSWSRDGNFIAFGSGAPPKIYQVPARGGEPQLLFEPERSEKGTANSSPHFLPLQAGAPSIVFGVGGRTELDIAVKNLETGEWELLAEGAFPVYSPSGHIVYQTNPRESGLWALPFSLETLKPTGEAFPIAEDVGEPSVAADGTLVNLDLLSAGQRQLLWRDREGKELGVIGRPQPRISGPVLSPDGRRVAAGGTEEGNPDVWVHEVERALKRRLTFDPAQDNRPQWSPSGEEITFQSHRQGNQDIFSRPADGTGEPVLLAGTDLPERPYDWSSDGKYLLYTVADSESGLDLWYLKRKEDGSGFEPVAFLQTPFNESAPNISPDGRFVAYCSNESGQLEVQVQPFPEGRGKWQVSTNSGCQPRWSKDGKELFYVEGGMLIAVTVRTTPSFSPGSVTPLFKDPGLGTTNPNVIQYDVSADGQRFVLVGEVETEEDKALSIHVVQNWFAEFRDRQGGRSSGPNQR